MAKNKYMLQQSAQGQKCVRISTVIHVNNSTFTSFVKRPEPIYLKITIADVLLFNHTLYDKDD